MYSPLQSMTPYGKYKNVSVSNLIATGAGVLVGVMVNSQTAGTLKFEDALTDTTPIIINTLTIGTTERWIPCGGARFTTGLYLVIGGTADVTVIFNQ